MPPRTRLDPVAKLQAHRETRSLQELAAANRKAAAAELALIAARQLAEHDARKRGNAADWLIAEHAHTRALADVATAERSAHQALHVAGASRVSYLAVHARTEALRRVIEARRDEAVRSATASERKESEDLFLTLSGRVRAA